MKKAGHGTKGKRGFPADPKSKGENCGKDYGQGPAPSGGHTTNANLNAPSGVPRSGKP